MKSEKKTRRNQQKYPGLNKKFSTRVRQEFHDFDYIDQLSEKDKQFLNKFIEEELNSQFENDGTDFNKTKEDRKKIYDRNNSANRCLYSNLKNKANKHNNKKLLNYDSVLIEVEDELNRDLDPMHMENAYVDYLEIKELEAMIEEYDQAMLNFSELDETLL